MIGKLAIFSIVLDEIKNNPALANEAEKITPNLILCVYLQYFALNETSSLFTLAGITQSVSGIYKSLNTTSEMHFLEYKHDKDLIKYFKVLIMSSIKM